MTSHVRVGVDLGGTGVRVVSCDDHGDVVKSRSVPSVSFGSDPLGRLVLLIKEAVPNNAVIRGIGIGASGPVDLKDGTIHNDATLPWFTGMRLGPCLAKEFKTEVRVDNDVVAAALGEHTGLTDRALLVVMLGTGVGSAMLIDGAPVRAADGQHPESGHIPVPSIESHCYCGGAHCWEQVASRTALIKRLKIGSPFEVFPAYGRDVASGLVTLITLYHPTRVVIGGGGTCYWEEFSGAMFNELARSREIDRNVSISPSRQGDFGGAIGAARLCEYSIGFRARPGQ